MSRTTLVTILLALSAWSPASAEEPVDAGYSAIGKTVQELCDPFVRTDRKALEALFTTDVDLLDADGSFRRGREAVVEQFLETNPGRRRSITHRTSHRLVGSDTALVEGSYRQAGDDRVMWAVVLLRYTPDGWKITAVRFLMPGAPVKFP